MIVGITGSVGSSDLVSHVVADSQDWSWPPWGLLSSTPVPSPPLPFPPLRSPPPVVSPCWPQVVGPFILWLKNKCSKRQGRSHVVLVTSSLQSHGVTLHHRLPKAVTEPPGSKGTETPSLNEKNVEECAPIFKLKCR